MSNCKLLRRADFKFEVKILLDLKILVIGVGNFVFVNIVHLHKANRRRIPHINSHQTCIQLH